jgi:DNA-binding CsgD family transcriptional regulator
LGINKASGTNLEGGTTIGGIGMGDANQNLAELTESVRLFCEKERAAARGGIRDKGAVTRVRVLFCQHCPRLCQQFLDAPDVVYARKIIDYAVAGINDPVTSVIWQEYYKNGITLEEMQHKVDYASRTVRRLIGAFSEKVTIQLWEKDLEIADPLPASPETLEQRAKRILQNTYDLTNRQADILLAHCKWQGLGIQELCDKVLFMSENTLKSHKKHILKRMGVSTMNPAVTKARLLLEKELGDEWKKLIRT